MSFLTTSSAGEGDSGDSPPMSTLVDASNSPLPLAMSATPTSTSFASMPALPSLKLDGGNWEEWRLQLHSRLACHGLLVHLTPHDGEVDPGLDPQADLSVPTRSKRANEGPVIALMVASLSSTWQERVADDLLDLFTMGPWALYTRLKGFCRLPSTQNVCAILAKITSFSLKDPLDLVSGWDEIKRLYKQLLDLGGSLELNLLIHYFISAIGEEWMLFKAAVQFRAESGGLSLAWVSQKVLLEQGARKPLPLAKKAGPRPSQPRRDYSQCVCWACDSSGHPHWKCPKPNAAWDRNPKNPKNLISHSSSSSSSRPLAKAINIEGKPVAFYYSFLIDSGCSLPLTRNRAGLVNYRALNPPREFQAAGGEILHAEGVGEAILEFVNSSFTIHLMEVS